MDREQITRESEEAEAELAAIKAAIDKEAADKLAATKVEPLVTTNIEDIFPDATATAAPIETGLPVATEVKPDAVIVDSADKTEITRLLAELAKSEQRFQSTFGNFNKTGMAELQKKVEELESRLATQSAPVIEIPTIDHDAMVQDLGEPATRLVEALQSKVTSLESALNDVTGQVRATGEKAGQLETVQRQDAARSYYTALDSLAPDWRKINGDDSSPQDPKYTAFLLKAIPGTDMTYDDAIKAYHEKGNSVKVAEIFNLFKATAAIVPAPAVEAKEELVTEPNKTGGGTPTPQPTPKPGERRFKQSEIDRFDDLKRAGKLKATQEQIDARESEIQQAILDGRVDP
jgi:hypothetical protein